MEERGGMRRGGEGYTHVTTTTTTTTTTITTTTSTTATTTNITNIVLYAFYLGFCLESKAFRRSAPVMV